MFLSEFLSFGCYQLARCQSHKTHRINPKFNKLSRARQENPHRCVRCNSDVAGVWCCCCWWPPPSHFYLSSFCLSRRITAELSLFEVSGLASNRPAPVLLSSKKAATGTGTPLLSFLFETNPLDESANQRLHVESQPLEIIYDAVSGVSERKFKSQQVKRRLDRPSVACADNCEQHDSVLPAARRPAAGRAHQRHPDEAGAVQGPHIHRSVSQSVSQQHESPVSDEKMSPSSPFFFSIISVSEGLSYFLFQGCCFLFFCFFD